jgi:hypothetical protein
VHEVGRTILAERKVNRHPGPRSSSAATVSNCARRASSTSSGAQPAALRVARRSCAASTRDNGRDFALSFQNEFLCLEDGEGNPLALTPDLICALDADGGLPVTTESASLRPGISQLIGLPADPQWRSPGGLELAGPGYFGYAHPFKPLEELANQRTPQTKALNLEMKTMKRLLVNATALAGALALPLALPIRRARPCSHDGQHRPDLRYDRPGQGDRLHAIHGGRESLRRADHGRPATAASCRNLAESWDISDDGLTYTFHACRRRDLHRRFTGPGVRRHLFRCSGC